MWFGSLIRLINFALGIRSAWAEVQTVNQVTAILTNFNILGFQVEPLDK